MRLPKKAQAAVLDVAGQWADALLATAQGGLSEPDPSIREHYGRILERELEIAIAPRLTRRKVAPPADTRN